MLIPVPQARELALRDLPVQPAERIAVGSLSEAHILASDVYSPHSHPLFDQSAVDGYALRHEDFAAGMALDLVDEVRAGVTSARELQAGECMRIFTGGAVPAGADTVVMQEFTRLEEGKLHIEDEKLKPGGNIRRLGEQILRGDLALQAGERLSPAAVGFLASLGIREVEVRRPPRVRILVTGDEFARGEEDLEAGKIYESNGQMLLAALAREGIGAQVETVPDDAETTRRAVLEAAVLSDLVLITGGVSVGDYDFTRPALEENGFRVIFHKVNQKPGKPLLYARREEVTAFGLPGNPRSVLMGYYMYVLPHLHTRMRATFPGLTQLILPLTHGYHKQDDGKTHFLTGRLSGRGVEILSGQGSHMLQSFARAQAIVTVPAERMDFPAGSEVLVSLLPK